MAASLVLVAAVGACGGQAGHPESADHPKSASTSAAPTTVTPGPSTTAAPTTQRPRTTAASTSTTTPAPPTTPACTNASVIASWPAARRAAELVVMPSFNFDLSGLSSLISGGIGGVLFLGDAPAPPNLGSQLAAAEQGAPPGGVPLVMADEEGGGIQRLSGLVSSFPWPRTIAATMTPAQTEALGVSVGTQMRQAGVTVNLAPVLDVDGGDGPNAADADGWRSFSDDPSTAASYGVAFMQGLRQAGVIPVVKHFPGLGGAADTDDGPAATQPLSELLTTGLPPFRAAIAAGTPAVMISNATVPGLTNLPASLSSSVIEGLLRNQLGFTGLIITDSLSAGAISQAGYSVPQAAVAAISAGADQILFGSTPALQTTEQVIDAIVAANASGALSTTELNQAVAQVIQAKGVNLCAP